MKRMTHLLLMYLAITTSLLASSRYIHNLDGTPMSITLCDSLVVIRFVPEAKSLASTFALQHDALRDDNTAIEKIGDFFAFAVEPGNDIDSLLADLRLDPAVEMAQATIQWDEQVVYAYDDLLVKPRADISGDSMLALFAALNLTLLGKPTPLRAGYSVAMTTGSPSDIFAVANQLYASGACDYSIPNFAEITRRNCVRDDRYFDHQWNLCNTTNPEHDIDMGLAWEMTRGKGDSSVVIAFIDRAFDIDHKDLNPSKIYLPYDAVGPNFATEGLLPDNNPRLPTNGNQQYDFYWHGTPCLGIMSAMVDNDTGMAGIAPQFRFMPIKDSDDHFYNSAVTVEAAWRWAINNSADVIGNSTSYTQFSVNVADAIEDAYAAGIPMFNSSGNSSAQLEFPATLPEVMAIGATNDMDVRLSFSSAGPGLDLVAPGASIFTLDISGYIGYSVGPANCENNRDYNCSFTGTSASAPHAAAVAALVLSRMLPSIRDTASVELLYGILRESADDEVAPDDEAGYDYLYGYGRLNAARALLSVVRGDADNDGIIAISDVVYINKFIFGGGPAPTPDLLTGDADCNGIVTISDSVWLITFIFGGGPPPGVCF